ncbi:hypothetical protein DVR12_14590 [Chitinophaga silvatica]|uniref:Uncharacterized protein n=1 Tax=Chitinophaga silvatica TaxID=2282649 RepID=A0A3E1Y8Z3_9BACT|nr:hypothetical protein [Chitinophaga silvatica]RFS21877.1 hypothetical protein DVR12_14590 [Chitinophaga silvatica]
MKHILLISLFFIISKEAVSQKITLTDISTFFKDTDAGAERLLSKAFDVDIYKIESGFKNFTFKDGDESILLEVTESREIEKSLRSCYSKKYHSDFEKLKQEVISKGKKIDFYLSEQYRTYYTVYLYNSIYFHFGKGVCTNKDFTYKYDSYFCTKSDIKF